MRREYIVNILRIWLSHRKNFEKRSWRGEKLPKISSFFKSPGTLLDIGCGSGSLLKECQDIGWDVYGVDPSEEAVKVAKETYGLTIKQCTFESYDDDQKFDCIVCIGIEHLQDPMECIAKATQLLNKNGILFFEAPSADSLLMKHLAKHSIKIPRSFY